MTKKLTYKPAKMLLRLPPFEHAAIVEAAGRENRSVNMWCRLVLRKAAEVTKCNSPHRLGISRAPVAGTRRPLRKE